MVRSNGLDSCADNRLDIEGKCNITQTEDNVQFCVHIGMMECQDAIYTE